MVRIPEQWFWMGCETGRGDEKPLHRVWVDSFELAAYQVTNAEYQCFLDATPASAPPCWSDPNFNDPKMPVARSEEHTSELQSRFDLVCRLLLEKKKYCSFVINSLVANCVYDCL